MIRHCPGTRGYITCWHGLFKVEAEFRRGGAQYKLKSVFKRDGWDNLDGYRLLADFIVLDSGERIDLLSKGRQQQ